MPKLAANLTMLFGDVEFLDRFKAAADAGFRGVEFLFPYAYEAEALKGRLQEHGLTQVLHNLPAGDWAAGERGIACLPDRVEEFEAGVARAISYATALECNRVNCLAGILPKTVDPDAARETFVRNLRYAAPRFEAAGIKLLIEPINTRDMPGFFLSGTRQALDIIDDVASDNLWCSTTSTTCTSWARTSRRRPSNIWRGSRTCSWPTSPAVTSPAPGDIDFGALFAHSIASAIPAGSAASTSRRRPRSTASVGPRRILRKS